MTTAVLAGSTGLVVRPPPQSQHPGPDLTSKTQGGHILTQLLAHPSIAAAYAYARRELPNPTTSTKLHPLTSSDNSTWPALFPRSPAPSLFLSALGTTRQAAGGVEEQRKIDLDLNYALASAAKDAGVTTYVLVSSVGASAKSSMPYPRMKGELEDKVKALGFEHVVILRPGLIMGNRSESRFFEAVFRGTASLLGKVSKKYLVDSWAQDSEVIARAAIEAGLKCVEGKKEEKVWELGGREILELGRVQK